MNDIEIMKKEKADAAPGEGSHAESEKEKISGFAKASLTCSIFSLIPCNVGAWASFMGTLAIVFGCIGLKRNSYSRRGTAKAGIGIGTAVVMFWLPSIIYFFYNYDIGYFTRGI